MLAITGELLSGRYVASEYNNRDRAEWPPHPARLFSALVAAWAEADGAQALVERRALEWLETLPPPQILASSEAQVARRAVAPHFVPVNDVAVVSLPDREKLDAAEAELAATHDVKARVKKQGAVAKAQAKLAADTLKAIAPAVASASSLAAAAAMLPERRTRKPRTFPSVTPSDPRFAFVWGEVQVPGDLAAALCGLCARVVRLGHSSSPVWLRTGDDTLLSDVAALPRLVPSENHGTSMLRWVQPGQFERLQRAFDQHRETEPRVLPARFVRYGEEDTLTPVEAAQPTIFDSEFVVFKRVGGPRLPVTSVAGLSSQVRRVLMSFGPQPAPEMLTGHATGGEASARGHVAVVPLPVVGGRHADGALLGVALIFPRSATEAEREAVMEAVLEWEAANGTGIAGDLPTLPVALGESGVLELERHQWGEPQSTLRPMRWNKPSKRWATATPIALDKNPGDLHDADLERRRLAYSVATETVRAALARVIPEMAPEVVSITLHRSCVLPGSAKPRNYPRFPANSSRPQRVLVHAWIEFARPVLGPLVVGAGRFQGLGLCLPVDGESPSTEEQQR